MKTARWRMACRSQVLLCGGVSLAWCGCVSTDEPLFHDVAAPLGGSESSTETTVTAALTPTPLGSAGTDGVQGVIDLQPSAAATQAPSRENDPAAAPPAAADGLPPVPPVAVPDDCATGGFLVCEGFEQAVPGSFPNGSAWLPELFGCGTHVVVDGAGTSHSGQRALRADPGGYPECMLHASLGGAKDVYVRTWVRFDAGAATGPYTSFLELGPRSGQDEPELRIGRRPSGDNLCPMLPGLDVSVSGLGSGPHTECSGVPLAPDRWYCVQAHVTEQAQQLTVSVSLDGEPLVDRAFTDLAATWMASDLYLKLGQAAYGPAGAGAIWQDDVVVSSTSVACVP